MFTGWKPAPRMRINASARLGRHNRSSGICQLRNHTEPALPRVLGESPPGAVARILSRGCFLHCLNPLDQCWAAGRGDDAAIELLLNSGADPFAIGKDRRTPYQIAVAANRLGAAKRIAAAETLSGRTGDAVNSSGQAARRSYCRAYTLGEVREFSGWTREQGERDSDDTVVFLHRDLTVTRTIWPHEAVLWDGGSAEWQHFCAERLAFRPPGDFDWLPASEPPNVSA